MIITNPGGLARTWRIRSRGSLSGPPPLSPAPLAFLLLGALGLGGELGGDDLVGAGVAGRRRFAHEGVEAVDELPQPADASVIELTVDDIAADATVVAAVQQRLNGGPSGVLDPGERVTLPIRAFNRGWARYPLLDSGTYTVVMDYVPQWEDAVLAAQRVGRVVSNQATITVTEGAPASVSRGGPEASLAVDREGQSLVAVLTNRTDQPMLINKNFGRSPPFADGRWVWELDGARRDVPLLPKPPSNKDLVYLKGLLERGKVLPVIDRRYTLSDVPEALRYLEKGHTRGKNVITI